MSEQEATRETTYDYQRYRRLLSEAIDETSRRRLIDLLVQERARDRLEVQRASDRATMTAETVAKVLGTKVLGLKVLGAKVLGTNGRPEPFSRG
ncbi:hypothetical protein [Bradyrhizobium sp. LTSPM299]|uniref:hypothetical protein n=1 Tax=Bradyrhizobium sp. LTSPM299 TaxID=1619233 RepID=UPI000B2A8BC5|nr:hypothetical protein [Bradyrhizobium sp. LTSPM299]